VGLFETVLVNAVVVMILFTCILGPAVGERFGLKVARAREAAPMMVSEKVERILVPLANPETSDDLMSMAFLMRDPDSQQPVHTLMVVADGQRMEEKILEYLKKVQHAVDLGVEAAVPVKPLTRIDMNIAHGIARAVQEEQASVVLIGWSGRASTRERIFGSVLDQLLDETHQRVFVNRFIYPLNTTRTVVLAIPPFVERCPGFYEAVHNVKLMASRIEAELHVICEASNMERDKKCVESIDPELEVIYESIPAWGDLESALDRDVDKNTFIVALSARPGTAPWFPELDEMPRNLANRYPDNSFSVVFLSKI
jgi:nucleotide-binding universal stress UspA family protein